jgi:hypothetical protein
MLRIPRAAELNLSPSDKSARSESQELALHSLIDELEPRCARRAVTARQLSS